MTLTYSPSIATAYADNVQVAKANLRAHLNQIETAIDAIDTTPSAGVYASVSAFNSATIPAALNQISVVSAGGEAITYLRQPGANGPQDLQHPNGSTWAKASLTQADLLAAITDVSSAIDRIPWQYGAFGTMTILPQTPGTFSCTYTVQRIEWERFGNTVEFSFRIAGTPTVGSASGQLRITGFPFATAAAMSGGFNIRASQGIDLQYYSGGTPSPPAFVSGFFPDAVQYAVISIGNATGQPHQLMPITRLTTGTPFRLEGWGEYRLQI